MTAKDVFELRKQGRIEEAYDAIRLLYANDKGPYTSSAMFWTASDILKKRLNEGRADEAGKIFAALERMLPNVPDDEGWVDKAFKKCQELVGRDDTRGRSHGHSGVDCGRSHGHSGMDHETLEKKGPEHLQTGIWGEGLAATYLREKGYVILERDWHSSHRDIDIIAQQGETIVFVEVKTRKSRDFADPVTAVNYQKQRNLLKAINHYLQYRHITSPHRFDVITIVGKPGDCNPEIEHIEDFTLPLSCTSGGRRWR